jgi:predicted nucleic acid-binding protein
VTGFLLDTNVVSELERSHPARAVVAFLRETPLEAIFLSDVIVAEIRFGIESVSNALRRDRLSLWLETAIRPMFAGRILPVTEDICLRWRLLMEAGRRQGYAFPQPDALIAATAAQHGLTVVTRDSEPFARASVDVVNPWRKR